jgi:hypothetical protein
MSLPIFGIINELANKGVKYIVGLYAYLYSHPDYENDIKNNVVNSLKPAFKKINANKIYQEIKKKFSNIEKSIKDAKEKAQLWNEAKNILKNYSETIQNEIENRIRKMSQKDKKVLSIACAVIESIKDKEYPALKVQESNGFVEVSYSDENCFSEIVSSILGKDLKDDVRNLFYKYLLGFQSDLISQRIYKLKIYPFVKRKRYIEKLASKASNYVKVPKKSEVKSLIERLYSTFKELYNNKEFIKLSAIECALSKDVEISKEFFSNFFGITPEQLHAITIEGIMNKGCINPLIYEYVGEAMDILEKEALEELKKPFKEVFEKAGYRYLEGDKYWYCAFRKDLENPIYIFFSAWPKHISGRLKHAGEGIKVVAIHGMPSPSILDFLEKYEASKALWIFLDREKTNIIIASNTYRSKLHENFLKILENKFSIKFLGPKPYINKKLSKDLLEATVASVLKDLGFSVKVGIREPTTKGTEIQIDVWGEKNIRNTKFIVYASCKNLDDPVKIDVIREEKGRIDIMKTAPHLKIIVAKSLTDEAKKEGEFYGFLVIELGEKIDENNAEKAYLKVYEILSKLFT